MVALPKRWVREMGLQQGSEIVITRPSLASLLITADITEPVRENQDATIEVSDRDNLDILFRKIVSLYILGYSQIVVRGGNAYLTQSGRDSIKDRVRRQLIGTEGVADSRDRMTIHVLLGYSELSVDNALKKMLFITDSMHRDSVSALEQDDKALAEGVTQREEEVGRFSRYVMRQLNMSINQGIFKEAILEPRDLLVYTQVSRTLERVASHAARMAEVVMHLEDPLPRQSVAKLASASEAASGLVEAALLALFKRDHAGADAVVQEARRFVQAEEEMASALEARDGGTGHATQVLVDSQKRIAEYARDIAEVVLDLTVERVVKKEATPYVRFA
jgi:phosphate uptake regulator